MKQPLLFVKLELESNANQPQSEYTQTGGIADKEVLFQVSKGQLKNILDNFEMIN